MILVSSKFLLLLLTVFLLYYIAPKRFQWWALLAASACFYLSAGIKLSVFLLFTTGIIYLGALLIGKIKANETEWEAKYREKLKREKRIAVTKIFERKKQWTVVMTLVLAFAPLVFLKYFNFFAQNINNVSSIFSTRFSIPILNLFLPLGISFYTFQAVGYLIDVYRGVCEPQRNPFKLSLYVAFFPSISQGPISRYNNLLPQLLAPHEFDYSQVTFGLQRILWGFFKKLVIADRIAILVNTVYSDPAQYPGFYVIVATIVFAFQLYTDFSGCMDIVIGSAQVFGITLPENFQTPYLSRSISEFWRRWHITLGTWLKDYLFYPLLKSDLFQHMNERLKKRFGKKTAKALTTYTGMFLLWFIVGLWHGSSWKFVFGVGLLHWFYIVSGEICKPLADKAINLLKINVDCFSWRLFQQIRTFMLVCVGYVFFRADTFKASAKMLLSIFTNFNPWVIFDKSLLNLGLDITELAIAIISLTVLLIVSVLQQRIRIREKMAEQNLVFRWIVFIVLFYIVVIYGMYGPDYKSADFIYQGF